MRDDWPEGDNWEQVVRKGTTENRLFGRKQLKTGWPEGDNWEHVVRKETTYDHYNRRKKSRINREGNDSWTKGRTINIIHYNLCLSTVLS